MMYRVLENMHGGVDVLLCSYIQHFWQKLSATVSCCISTHLCITGCDQISSYHQETTATFQAPCGGGHHREPVDLHPGAQAEGSSTGLGGCMILH